jgi:hypothetical protein
MRVAPPARRAGPLLRLRRQAAFSGDAELTALGDELGAYPGVSSDPAA